MKIKTEVKYKDLPEYVKEHLTFIDVGNIKFMVIAATFFFLDLFLLVPLLYPMASLFLYLTVPFMLLIHLWAIRLLFKNPYSIQFEIVLFLGIFGMIGSYCYYVIAQKVAYYYVGVTSSSYYILLTILYVIVVIILVMYQINKYSGVKKQGKSSGKKVGKYATIAALAPALGYFFTQYMTKQSEFLTNSIILIVLLFFAVVLGYVGAKLLHKYLFMKANMQFVSFQKPLKKDRGKFKEKGVEIK